MSIKADTDTVGQVFFNILVNKLNGYQPTHGQESADMSVDTSAGKLVSADMSITIIIFI